MWVPEYMILMCNMWRRNDLHGKLIIQLLFVMIRMIEMIDSRLSPNLDSRT